MSDPLAGLREVTVRAGGEEIDGLTWGRRRFVWGGIAGVLATHAWYGSVIGVVAVARWLGWV